MQHNEKEAIAEWDRNIGQSLQTMDEDAADLWVEEMINHLKKSSPNVPVYQILKYLHSSIYCCSSPFIKSAAESRLLYFTQFSVLPNHNTQIIDKNNRLITQSKTRVPLKHIFENTIRRRNIQQKNRD